MAETMFFTGNGRVFLQRNGSNPQNATVYLGCHRVGGFDHPLGDITPVYCPDPAAYQKYKVAGSIQGEAGLPSTSLMGVLGIDNPLMSLACPFDLHVHFGKCANPTDFDAGWDYGFIFTQARLTSRSSDDLTAMSPGDEAQVMLTGDLTSEMMMEKKRLSVSPKAGQQVFTEVVGVAICDSPDCGACGTESDGCQDIYAVTVGTGAGSPGLPAEVVYSLDGGSTWTDEDIATLATNEDPSDIACAGEYIIVPSNDSGSYHYISKTDLEDTGSAAWAEQAGGIVVGGEPNAVWAYDAYNWWLVGDGGYVYKGETVGEAVVAQAAGDVTAQNLLDVHGLSADFVVAVGENAAVIYTENGTDWVAAAGAGLPAAASLLCVAVRSEYVWLVGTSTGQLFYTSDKGATFVEVTFPSSGTGAVRDIVFAGGEPDSPIGYMAHSLTHIALGDRGYILETTNGGRTWFRVPRAPLTLVANDRINALATCHDPNLFVGGGLNDDGADGIVLLGSA